MGLTVIEKKHKWNFEDFKELWKYRDLLKILAERDIRLRYKQTALGFIWAILQPLVPSLIFTIIFGMFAKLPSNGYNYMIFVFCGTMIWNLFSHSIDRGGNSLVQNERLISKVYFPRILIPLSSIGAVLFDFIITGILLIVLMIIFKVPPTLHLLVMPLFLILALITAAGISFWLSALNVKYRDFMYAAPFMIQIWLYATPVVYSSSIVPSKYQWIYSINPAVGFVEGFRYAILGKSSLTSTMIAISSVASVIALVSGLIYFKSVERQFADVI
jgi:lipopolysaccharide transport system permease protein